MWTKTERRRSLNRAAAPRSKRVFPLFLIALAVSSPLLLGPMAASAAPLAGASPLTRAGDPTPDPRPIPPPAPAAPAVVLYDQYDNDLGGSVATVHRSDHPRANAKLADDFVFPAGQSWSINQVDVRSGPPAPRSFNVFFYSNSGALPGTEAASRLNVPLSGVHPDYTIALSTPS